MWGVGDPTDIIWRSAEDDPPEPCCLYGHGRHGSGGGRKSSKLGNEPARLGFEGGGSTPADWLIIRRSERSERGARA